ncbi:Clp protease [Salmonella enterica]|nr:Clp protease [Salmonella enterica subsp. enterica serovar Typhimurium]KAB0545789.1 Clp protease [Pantoea stewartii subsp. stewartii]
MHVFLAQSDVSQIRDAYTDEERERLAAAIRQNTSIRYSLNPGDER